jgi:8-oxo-dGTP pyrophosphatase MutT (NUDIX family)
MKKGQAKRLSDQIRNNTSMKEFSFVAVSNVDTILWGKRRDNNLYSLPGGHINPGETPHQGASRELYEETGIKTGTEGLVYLGFKLNDQGDMIHCFRFDVKSRPESIEELTTENDPDQEFSSLKWVEIGSTQWHEVLANSHELKNFVLEYMGLQ